MSESKKINYYLLEDQHLAEDRVRQMVAENMQSVLRISEYKITNSCVYTTNCKLPPEKVKLETLHIRRAMKTIEAAFSDSLKSKIHDSYVDIDPLTYFKYLERSMGLHKDGKFQRHMEDYYKQSETYRQALEMIQTSDKLEVRTESKRSISNEQDFIRAFGESTITMNVDYGDYATDPTDPLYVVRKSTDAE